MINIKFIQPTLKTENDIFRAKTWYFMYSVCPDCPTSACVLRMIYFWNGYQS